MCTTNQSTRHRGDDEQIQMELGWSCREKNRQSIDDPQHLSSARPGDTEGTKEDKRRNGGTTSTVSKQKKTPAPCRTKPGPVEVSGESPLTNEQTTRPFVN